MPLAGVTPNVISYSATISSCEKGAQWQHALALWQEMPSKHVLPNLYTHNSTISSLEKGAQWHMAVMIFGHLPAAKIRPDVVTFSATMSACCSGGASVCATLFLGQIPGSSCLHGRFHGAVAFCCQIWYYFIIICIYNHVTLYYICRFSSYVYYMCSYHVYPYWITIPSKWLGCLLNHVHRFWCYGQVNVTNTTLYFNT